VWTIALTGLMVTIIYLGGLALLVWSWWRARRAESDQEFCWTLGITLVVSNLISPRTATTDYELMLVPPLALFAALDRTPRWGRVALIALMLISLIGLWWLHIATVQGNWEQAVMYLPWPLALGLVWVLARALLLEEATRMGVLP
jgi:branched-subunit amino acid ABC-type transport system permease component